MAKNYELDTAPLKGKIREIYGSQEKFAETAGYSVTQVVNILSGRSDMSRKTVLKFAALLGIEPGSTEFNRVFFSQKT